MSASPAVWAVAGGLIVHGLPISSTGRLLSIGRARREWCGSWLPEPTSRRVMCPTAAWGRRDDRVRQHPSQARAAAERGDVVFAATCGDAPPLTLLRLACANGNDVRGAAGVNPGLPVGHLPVLAQGISWVARQGAARNLLCPPALMEALSNDKDHDVRSAVAGNRACPEELPRGIHQHRPYEFDVLESLSSNPSAPADVLRTLAGDDSDSFRANIAANPSCPPEMAAALAGHPSA